MTRKIDFKTIQNAPKIYSRMNIYHGKQVLELRIMPQVNIYGGKQTHLQTVLHE